MNILDLYFVPRAEEISAQAEKFKYELETSESEVRDAFRKKVARDSDLRNALKNYRRDDDASQLLLRTLGQVRDSVTISKQEKKPRQVGKNARLLIRQYKAASSEVKNKFQDAIKNDEDLQFELHLFKTKRDENSARKLLGALEAIS